MNNRNKVGFFRYKWRRLKYHTRRHFMRGRKWDSIIEKVKEKYEFSSVSYAQNSEDTIISLLIPKRTGFYVDVGAHNPVSFSNTFLLYVKGWRGINIDPLPGCKEEFEKFRPDDINLNIGISSVEGSMTYYNFTGPAYNTLDEKRAEEVLNDHLTELKEKINVPVKRLDDIFDKYLHGEQIDVLTIDVETRELDVLKSNDWSKYRPNLIVMESLASGKDLIKKAYEDLAVQFLVEQDYDIVSKIGVSIFLVDQRRD